MALRIAVLDDYQKVAKTMTDWSAVDAADEVVVFHDHVADPARLVERLKDFDVVCIMRERTPITAAVIEKLPRLKLLCTTGMRNASVDTKALAARQIPMCGTGGSVSATAELAWGLTLGLLRHIAPEDRGMRAGGWQTTVGRGVMGKTIGVLGLGKLGGMFAKVATAFGADVIAWSANLTAERAAAGGATLVTKDALFARSDVISIHLVLSDRSRGLVGAADLARMKPTALLINTSRGPIVDGAALIDALEKKRIAGAGLDVYDEEPLPASHKLRTLDNVLLTPHLGYVTEETFRAFYGETVENILAWKAGKPVRVIAPA